MKTDKLNYISFSEVKEIGERLNRESIRFPYVMKNDIGMLFGGTANLTKILSISTPYILEEPRIAVVRKGTAHIMTNMIEREIHENMLVYIGKGTVIQPQSFSRDIEICGMMLGNERLGLAMSGSFPPFAANSSYIGIEAAPHEALFAYRLFVIIWDLLHYEDLIDGSINGILHSLLYYYGYLNKRNESDAPLHPSHAQQMFERFMTLINTHCKEHHSLDFYADKMCVTQRYLGIVVHNASGITAKKWIDRAVATRMKVMLRHSSRQIAQISDELHFPNSSFFCKFFKRMTGITPQEYRRCDTSSGTVISR